MKLGMIGLGYMGRPMAERLAAAGHELTATDIDVSKCSIPGVRCVTDIASAVSSCEMVITSLPAAAQVKEVVQCALQTVMPGTVFIDTSTIETAACVTISNMAREKRCSFVDAPVSGGVDGARNGTLTVFVGASAEDYRRVKGILSCIGSKITYMGDVGAGQMAKCCNQVIGAITLQAVCEGLTLARKAGLDLATFLEAALGGASDSFMLKYVGSRVLKGDDAPGFKIRLELKDLGIALQAAGETLTPLPALALVNQLFMSRAAAGKQEIEGNQALIHAYEELSHIVPLP